MGFTRDLTMRSVILEIKQRLDIGRSFFNVSLSSDAFLRSRVTRDCLKCMGKVPVDREILPMVVIIGRIVVETSFRRKVGLGSRSHCLFERHAKV